MTALLGIDGLDRTNVSAILDAAEPHFRSDKPPPEALAGRTVINAFLEASTRTRASFEIAAKRLGAHVVNITASGTSVEKGESLVDTMLTLDAMRPDVIVLRHPTSGASALAQKHVRARVINGGDGTHEHPTQALLDAFVMRRRFGKLEGLVVCIVGDIAHSRVARSNAMLLRLFGAEVRFTGPPTLLPPGLDSAFGAKVFDTLERAVEGADVVMALRIQNERLSGPLLASAGDYAKRYRVDASVLARAKPNAIVMHPGPMNRGVEIESELADSPRSMVREQVEAGVAVRMAVLARAVA